MNFLDYVKKGREHEGISSKGDKKARMPLMLVLLGKYEEQEISILQEQLSCHMNLSNHVFWICMNDCKGIKENSHVLPIENKKLTSLKEREEFAERVNTSQMNEILDEAASDVMDKISGINFAENNTIRIAILVKTDQAASGMMFPLAKMLAENFSTYFFNNVYVELYLFVDQGVIPLAERGVRWASNYLTIKEAESLYAKEKMTYISKYVAHMIYFFSNVQNNGILLAREEAWKEHYASIALLQTMKTMCGENKEYVYSDKDYSMAVKNAAVVAGVGQAGIINSAGCVHLERNEYLIRLIVYRTVWKKLCSIHEKLDVESLRAKLSIKEADLSRLISGNNSMKKINEMDTKSIVRHSVNPDLIYQMKNGEAVNRIFGNNLDLFMMLNATEKEAEKKKLDDWYEGLKHRLGDKDYRGEANPFDLDLVFSQIEDEIKEKVSKASDLSSSLQSDFEIWKEKMTRLGKKAKGGELIYALADGYCAQFIKYRSASREKENCEKLHKTVKRIGKEYHEFVMFINATIAQLTQEIDCFFGTEKVVEALQTAHTQEYYEALTIDILNNNYSFGKLVDNLVDYVGREEALMEAVIVFCEKDILGKEAFIRDFMKELLKRLPGYKPIGGRPIQTKEDVFGQLLAVIDDNFHYMCKDIFNGMDIYRQSSYFMADNAIANVHEGMKNIYAEMSQNKSFNMFCDKHSDQFDVLYLVGNISAEKIQFMNHYQKQYEILCGEV